jgi:hypothetical protein
MDLNCIWYLSFHRYFSRGGYSYDGPKTEYLDNPLCSICFWGDEGRGRCRGDWSGGQAEQAFRLSVKAID